MDIDLESLAPFIAKIDSWIDGYINAHKEKRVRVADLDFPNLPRYFGGNTLAHAHVVYTDQIKAPPLNELGIDGFSFFETLNAAGITYKGTFFIATNLASQESIHFHELIHTIQWDELGVEEFIKVYGIHLLEHGYRQHPLEVIAYDLQAAFDQGRFIADLEPKVRSHCRKLADGLGA